MLATILGLITGLAGPIAEVINKITDLKAAKVKAESDTELARINASLEEAHDRKAVLVAEAGQRIASTINASVRLLLTIPAAVILWKLLVHDKVLGSYHGCAGHMGQILQECVVYRTDDISAYEWGYIVAVISFYYVYDMTKGKK